MRKTMKDAFSPGRAIQHGIEGVRRLPGPLLVGSLLLWVTGGGTCGWGGSSPGGGDGAGVAEGLFDTLGPLAVVLLVLLLVGAAVLLVAVWGFRSWLHPGYLRLHRALITKGEADFGVLFGGADALWRMLWWKGLATVVELGVTLLAALPGALLAAVGNAVGGPDPLWTIPGAVLALLLVVPVWLYVHLGLLLGTHAVALDGMAPGQALNHSWELARGNRIPLLVFVVVTGLFEALGILACCVGMVLTGAIVHLGLTEAYLLATRDDWEGYALVKELGPG